jgi:hypothetical protein
MPSDFVRFELYPEALKTQTSNLTVGKQALLVYQWNEKLIY